MQFLKVNSIDFFSSIAVSFFIKVFKHRPFKIHMFKKCVTVCSLVQFLKDNSTIFTIITAQSLCIDGPLNLNLSATGNWKLGDIHLLIVYKTYNHLKSHTAFHFFF